MPSGWFCFDPVAVAFAAFAGGLTVVLMMFSSRHLASHPQRTRYLTGLLLGGVAVMALSLMDHWVGVASAFCLGYLVCSLLLIPPSMGRAQFLRMGLVSTLSLCLGLWLIHQWTGITTLSGLTSSKRALGNSPAHFIATGIFLLAVLSQLGQWPFHRTWMDVLNVPTPVLAWMHAVWSSAGGILLIRFRDLFQGDTVDRQLLFIIGSITALGGAFWKLVQTDQKRVLAASTSSQLGFSIMQCGMGWFSVALAHWSWHGCLKAYWFLRGPTLFSSSDFYRDWHALKSPRLSILQQIVASLGAVSCFAAAWGHELWVWDTRWMLFGLVALTGAEGIASVLRQGNRSLSNSAFGIGLACGMGGCYGLGLRWTRGAMGDLDAPQSLHFLHVTVLALFLITFWGVRSWPKWSKSKIGRSLYWWGVQATGLGLEK